MGAIKARTVALAGVATLVFAAGVAPDAVAQAAAVVPRPSLPVYLLYLGVVAGAVGMALGTMVYVLRNRLFDHAITERLRRELAHARSQHHAMRALVEASPAVMLVWEDDGEDATAEDDGPLKPVQGLGKPKILGSALSLGRLLGVSADTRGSKPVIEAFVEGLHGEDREPFLTALEGLRSEGMAFVMTLRSAAGCIFEVEGRPLGQRAVVWLRDSSEQVGQIVRLEGELAAAKAERAALAEVLDALPVPVWQTGRDGGLVWVNAAYAKAVDQPGQTEAVASGTPLHEAQTALVARTVDAPGAARAREHAVIEGMRRALDLLVVGIPGGRGAAGIALDATELEDTQGELDRHVKAHAETLNALATAVAIYGADQRLVFHNKAFQKLWHLDDEWLHGHPSEGEIIDRLRDERRLPEQADFRRWKTQRLARYANTLSQAEEIWQLPDDRTLRVVCRPHPFGGLIYLYENVTDHVRLETRYNQLTNVQRVTLDNLLEGVAVFGTDGRLKLHNAEFSKMWQLEAEKLADGPHVDDVARWCGKLIDIADGWAAVKTLITAAGADRAGHAGQLNRKDGSILRYASSPLPDGGTLVSFTDMTDSIRHERALKERNDALEQADKLKSDFVTHVSYQLRVPLNSIIGFTEMLDQQMFGTLNVKQLEYTGGVLQASHDLLSLIDNLLDLATIEAGRMVLERSDSDLASVLKSLVEIHQKKAIDAKIQLKLEGNLAGLGHVWLDEKRVKQMIANVIANALSFTPEGGRVLVGAERAGGQLKVWVSDTGTGIDPRHQPVVFDRFEAFGRGARRGAGLGLSLVKSFAELHGGWVALKSMPGAGTTVTIYLPDEREAQAAE